jgi:hypothetical protein
VRSPQAVPTRRASAGRNVGIAAVQSYATAPRKAAMKLA